VIRKKEIYHYSKHFLVRLGELLLSKHVLVRMRIDLDDAVAKGVAYVPVNLARSVADCMLLLLLLLEVVAGSSSGAQATNTAPFFTTSASLSLEFRIAPSR
jgi:hypothetical protein